MSQVTATHTVSDVIKHVQRQFGDESGVQVTSEDIIRWVNLAQNEIFRRNEPVKATSTADLVAGQYKYTFPSNILQVEKMRANGSTVRYMSFQEAEEYVESTDPTNASTGTPQIWYEYGGTFMFWPVPDKSVVGGIDLFYVPVPTAVAAPTDILSVPDTYYNRLLEYVLKQAYEMDENFEAAQIKDAQFSEGLSSQSLDGSTEANVYPRITVLAEDM
jgi:hypothetical protein